jgi:hypothetical protein
VDGAVDALELEAGAAGVALGECEIPAVGVGDSLHDGEAEPRPVARRVTALEDGVALVGRDAGTVSSM